MKISGSKMGLINAMSYRGRDDLCRRFEDRKRARRRGSGANGGWAHTAAMNEIYRWLISEQRGDGCLHECGWVQRKTNRAYRIDRRNPEHVRRLSSAAVHASLSLSPSSCLSPSETDRERNSSSTVCVPGLTLRALSRPTYIRVETLHSYPPVRRPSDRRECVSVFVLARGWIVTTAEDTRLNTPTIVTIEREGEGERRGGRVSTPRVISVTILLFPPCPSSRCIRPFIVPLCPG